MNYWNEVKRNALMIPLMLIVMFLSYSISVYVGWREPVEDITIYIPTFMGGIFSYIFLTPYVNYYIGLNPNL